MSVAEGVEVEVDIDSSSNEVDVGVQSEAIPSSVPGREKQEHLREVEQHEDIFNTTTNKHSRTTKEALSSPLTSPMPPGRPLPLLICSLGNPGASYANTLHSAGHTVLNRLAEHLNYPGFHKERSLGNGLVSKGGTGEWTLWQSTSYMNESGKGVAAAYRGWSKNLPDGEGRLVIVHDELEKPLGAVGVKTAQGGSAKGHNGLKSIMGLMAKTPFVRLGVGIGRPVSRESADVAKYVLKKMGPVEMAKMEGCVVDVVARLEAIANG